MAILYGMRLASDKNVRHLIVESDSELAIKLISEGCEVMLGEGEGWFLIFLDTAALCESCSFQHVNGVADNLAKMVLST